MKKQKLKEIEQILDQALQSLSSDYTYIYVGGGFAFFLNNKKSKDPLFAIRVTIDEKVKRRE